MDVIEIKNEFLSVGINTLGSELVYINGAGGTEFLWNGDESVWRLRAPILFPICGGLKDDRYTLGEKSYHLEKHGFAQTMEFCGKKLCETKVEFVLEANEKTLCGFPFLFRLKIIFQLEKNRLRVINTVENLSDKTMYFSVGAHEGYACPEGIEEYEIRFDENQSLESYVLNGNLLENTKIGLTKNSKSLPLKYEYFAVDALVFKNVEFCAAELVHKNGKKKVRLETGGAPYFLLWTKPGAKYICLEPWHGVQDIVGSDFDLEKKEGINSLKSCETKDFVHVMEFFE